MSRFCGERDSEPLHQAGIAWRDRALYQGQSVFGDKPLWTTNNVAAIEQYFSNNPDEGSGDFFEKLEGQLEPCSDEVKQLAAEMLWLLLIAVSNIGPDKKRASVQRVWSWSGDVLPDDHPLLSDSTLTGVGSGGTAYNTSRWRELGYLIDITKQALALPSVERQAAFDDFERLGQWLTKIADNEKRQFRHMLLFMLHPDQAERIFSNGDRWKIVSKFTGKPLKSVKQLSSTQLDQMLLGIRQEKEAEFGTTELCFYIQPLRGIWKEQETRNWLFVWNPSHWAWEDLPDQIARTRAGKPALIRWTCANQTIAPGDRAWLVRLGQEPKGVMATGNVVSDPYEAEHHNDAKASEGKTGTYVDIEFSVIRDVFKDPIVGLNELNTITIDNQQWSPQSSGIEIKPRSAALLEKLWGTRTAGQPKPQLAQSTSAVAVAEPINKIVYGPPGTGKTFRLNQLKQRYVVKQSAISHEQWLSEQLKPVSWFDVVFMCLHDLGGKGKVKDIEAHPFFVQKAKAVGRQQHLKAQVWATLQAHTVEESTTVKYKNRVAPLVFDKQEDSAWCLTGNWQEDCEEQVARAAHLKQGAPQQADQVHYAFVTFHQAYSYEDFVEGIRPVQDPETDQLVYRVEPGIFRQICQDARNAPDTRFALFIDEINRGNIAKIFGELITLIEPDKRTVYNAEGELVEGMELTLPYSRERFGVPRNLDIYGTMNTADRSIALLDTALRRRFQFEELMPNAKVIAGSRGDGYIEDGEGGLIDLRALLNAMNRRIRFLLNRDLTLGHAYLHSVKDFRSLRDVFVNQLIPLLQEYFYNDWHRIQLVLRDVGQDHQAIEPQIIEHQVVSAKDILGFDHDEFEDMVDYRVADPASITPEAIRKIYEDQE